MNPLFPISVDGRRFWSWMESMAAGAVQPVLSGVIIGAVIACGLWMTAGTAAAQTENETPYRAYLPLVVYDVPSVDRLEGTPLVPGEPQQGIVGGDTQFQIYSIEIEPGRLVSLRLESATPAEEADVNLFVYAPDSTVDDLLFFNYWAVSSNYGNNEAINMIMPDAGRWFVVVQTDFGTVSYRLSATVQPLENTDAAQVLEIGGVAGGELSLDNLVDVYRVTAETNQRLTALVDFGYELEVALYPPGVTDIYTTQPRSRSFGYWSPFIASAASRDAGDWYVVVRSYLGSRTDYRLTIVGERAETADEATPLEERVPKAGTLSIENLVDLYKIGGRPDEILSAEITVNEGGYLTPRIYSPAAADVFTAQPRVALQPWDYAYDYTYDRATYRMTYRLDADGDWLVEVAAQPYNNVFDLRYQIVAITASVTDTVRAMPLTPGKVQHGYVDTSTDAYPQRDDYDVYAVTARAGQRLHLELTSDAYERTLALYEPGTYDFSRASAWSYRSTYAQSAPLLVDALLPRDGTWYVVVRLSDYGSTGNYYVLNSTLTDTGSVDQAVPIQAGDVISDRIPSGESLMLYALEARQGERIEAELSGMGGDADLYLFPPETELIFRDDYVALSAGPTVQESLAYAVPQTGRWYLAVVSYARLTGSDEETDFTLAVDIRNRGVNGASVMGGMVETVARILPPQPK